MAWRQILIFQLAILLFLMMLVLEAQGQDARYCREHPDRDSDGFISRDAGELRRFQKTHPCPSTGKTDGTCPGWAIDHVIPLAVGGCDTIINMQWLPDRLKSSRCGKDRFERDIYARPFKSPKEPPNECYFPKQRQLRYNFLG